MEERQPGLSNYKRLLSSPELVGPRRNVTRAQRTEDMVNQKPVGSDTRI